MLEPCSQLLSLRDTKLRNANNINHHRSRNSRELRATYLGTMKQNKDATIMRSIGAFIRGDLSLPVSIRAPIVAEKNMGAIPSAGRVLAVTIPCDRIKGKPSRNASIVIMRSWR